MQMRISRSRLAGDPPEVLITPRLAHLGLLDFHRAEEAIEAGHHAACCNCRNWPIFIKNSP